MLDAGKRQVKSFFHLERTGTSLHFWAGPVGIHIWRHRSPYRFGMVSFGWFPNWKEPMEP